MCSNTVELLEEKLQSSAIKSYIEENVVSYEVDLHVKESIGSTNDFVMSLGGVASNRVVACFANAQSKGKGRNGKRWFSPANSNIYMSVGFDLTGLQLKSLGGLSLACGVAIANMLEVLGIQPQLKWPNDVWVNAKKIAGILIETRVKGSQITAVIGVGLNVSMEETCAQNIDQPWTDLVRCLGLDIKVDKNRIASMLLESVVEACSSYKAKGFNGDMMNSWEKYDVLKGGQVDVVRGEKKFTAEVLGVNQDGSLEVVVDGSQQSIYAADVNVKLIK